MNESDRKLLEKTTQDVVNAINALRGKVEGLVFELGSATSSEESSPKSPPVETAKEKLARLDPDEMTKHRTLWEIGDVVEIREGDGDRRHIAAFYWGRFCVEFIVFAEGGVDTISNVRWVYRPILPDGTRVILFPSRGLYYTRKQSGNDCCRYTLYYRPYSDSIVAFDNQSRSDFRVIALPEGE